MAASHLTTYLGFSPETRHFLRVLSWLAPAPVPASLLPTFPHPDSTQPYTDPTPAITELESSGHLGWSTDRSTFTLHPGLIAAARSDLPLDESPPATLLLALHWVNRAMPPDTDDMRTWHVAVPLLPHAVTVAKAGGECDIVEPSARLLNQAALLEKVRANHRNAEPLYRRALELNLNHFGNDHPDVAASLSNLAQLLHDTNRVAEAEQLMRRALSIWETILPCDHPQIAAGLNNLASLFQDTNRLAEAEPLSQRALGITEKLFGSEHPNVATSLNNLAQLLEKTNRLPEAETLMRRALAIDEAAFGSEHPSVARDLNNLAALLQVTNRLMEAEPLMRRALAIDEKSFGTEHPKIAIRLNNLATILDAMGNKKDAEIMYRTALSIDEKSYSSEHPNVAIRLNNLAQLLKGTNRLAEAEPLMRRQLEIFVNFSAMTKHSHPYLEAACGNYVGLLEEMGETDEQIREKIGKMLKPILK